MNRHAFLLMGAAAGSLGLLSAPVPGRGLLEPARAIRAPEFTHAAPAEWLNSKPLTLAALAGKVVLVEFWTFDCHNCHRTVPWLRELYARTQSRGVEIVGVHTPEFERERVADNVRAKLVEYRIRYPVMLDNDYSYWNALGNRYWPAFYLVDRQGRVRAVYAGETHAGDAQARRIEADLEALASPS